MDFLVWLAPYALIYLAGCATPFVMFLAFTYLADVMSEI